MSKVEMKSPNLEAMLKKFTSQVVTDNPSDLITYAAEYFNNLKRQKEEKSFKPLNQFADSDDEDILEIEIMTDLESKRKIMQSSNIPRESIICERFDPSTIDDDTFESKRKIFSKSTDQQEKISEILKSIFLFNCLDENQIYRVIESMFPLIVESGEIIIKENDPGDNLYVIDRGHFFISNESGTINQEYIDEGYFGELALLYNCPRAATIVAKSDGLLWAMDRISFRQLILKSAYNKRKRLEELLKSITLLRELTEYDRCNLADALKTVVFHNSVIITQGELGNEMYFIEDGEAAVISKDKNGIETEIRRLKTGDYFGEVAILAEIPRIASVHAIGTVKLAALDVKSYNRLMGPCIEMMRRNFTKYEDRLRNLMTEDQMNRLFPELVQAAVKTNDTKLEIDVQK